MRLSRLPQAKADRGCEGPLPLAPVVVQPCLPATAPPAEAALLLVALAAAAARDVAGAAEDEDKDDNGASVDDDDDGISPIGCSTGPPVRVPLSSCTKREPSSERACAWWVLENG